jgi:hypothetical protein
MPRADDWLRSRGSCLARQLEVLRLFAADPTTFPVRGLHRRSGWQRLPTKLHGARTSIACAWLAVASCGRHIFLLLSNRYHVPKLKCVLVPSEISIKAAGQLELTWLIRQK